MYTDIENDIDKQKVWFENICTDSNRLDWIIRVDEKDVGLISIYNIDSVNRRCEFGYYLSSPNTRGKGIGKSALLNLFVIAFEKIKLHKFCCEALATNVNVIKLYERCGLVREGVRQEHIFKNGEYLDIVEMGLLKEQWDSKINGHIEFTPARIEKPNKELKVGSFDL